MGTSIKLVRIKRKFSSGFKKQLVSEYERGQYSVLEMSRLHSIKVQLIYNWIYQYSHHNKKKTRIVEMSESSSKKVSDLEKRIKELEQIVGQKQIKIDYLDKLIEIASADLGVNIKKNTEAPHSVILGKTEKR